MIKIVSKKSGARNCDSQLRTTNQQVHWVVQVIPYVSKGRSHGDCWLEAIYGYLVNLSQEINYDYQFELRKNKRA